MDLPVMAPTFILIGFVGPYMPGVPNHSGVPLNQFIGMNHLSVEKVFKVPLGVSADLRDRFDHYGRAGRPPLFFRVHFGNHLPWWGWPPMLERRLPSRTPFASAIRLIGR